MAFKVQGFSGTQNEVEANTRALRTVVKPLDVGANGSYRFDTVTGTMAAGLGAAAEIFQFRWTNAVPCYLRQVRMSMHTLGTGFTAGVGLFELVIARAWSVDGSGGTTITMGATGKLRSDFASSVVGAARIATTVVLSGLGTKTLDTYAASTLAFVVGTGTNAIILPPTDLYQAKMAGGEHPIILEASEGFVIRATVPATGTWIAHVMVNWSELTEY